MNEWTLIVVGGILLVIGGIYKEANIILTSIILSTLGIYFMLEVRKR